MHVAEMPALLPLENWRWERKKKEDQEEKNRKQKNLVCENLLDCPISTQRNGLPNAAVPNSRVAAGWWSRGTVFHATARNP